MEEYEVETPQESESLSGGLKVSLLAHALILAFFTVKTAFFAPESIDYQAAVRVDLVGLPDKIEPKILPAPEKKEAKAELPPKPEEKKPPVAEKKPPAPPKPEPKAKVVPVKDKDAVKIDKTKSKQKEAMEKLKAMAALEKIKDEVVEEKKKEISAGKDKAGPPKIKGNVLAAGTAITGLAKLQHDTYVADLDTHIKKNWEVPEWLAKKDYKAQVRVKIDDRGNILSRQITKSSGNPNYDDAVLAAIDKSAPFPPPPEKFISIVTNDGILIGFPE